MDTQRPHNMLVVCVHDIHPKTTEQFNFFFYYLDFEVTRIEPETGALPELAGAGYTVEG